MREIFYPLDGPSIWRRIALLLAVASTTFLFTGMIVWQGSDGSPTLIGMAVAVVTVFVVGAELLIALSVQQVVADGLRLDETGLTHLRGGKEVFRGWREVSAFRLRGRFHPVNLLAGRCISYQAPTATVGSLPLALLNRIVFWGHNTVLGDNYLVRSEELVERLNAYRDIATGAEPKPDRAEGYSRRAPPPALFTVSSTLDKRKRLKRLGFAALAVLGVGLLTAGLLFLAENTWPEILDMLLDSGLAILLALPFLMMFVHWLPMRLWGNSPASNLLLVSEGGIQYRRGALRRHWLWDEVFDIALREAPLGVPSSRSARTISLTAAQAGDKPGKVPADERPSPATVTSFEEIYDAPLEEIEAVLRAWADWRHPMRDGMSASPSPGSFVRSIRFAHLLLQPRGAIEKAVKVISFVWMPAGLILSFYLLDVLRNFGLPGWLGLPLFMLFGVLVTAPLLLAAFLRDTKLNYLDLDARGLTWRHLGFRYRWEWRDLPYFELRAVEMRWSRKPVAVILFVVQQDNRFARFLRWAHRIDGDQPRIIIEDIHASPIDEILTTINEYHRPRRTGPEPEVRPKIGVFERMRAAIRRISRLPMGANSR